MKLAIICLMVSGCYAVPKNMTGEVIIFPEESNTAHVKVIPAVEKIFFAVTVCLRFFTDYNKEQAPFSISTPSHADGFVFFRGDGGYRLYIGDEGIIFYHLPTELNEWNSVCVTWDSTTGLAQFWVNGKPSAKKTLQAGMSIAGTKSIILGQDQDVYGGGFNVYDAFFGHVTDVHMWDKVLPSSEIENYMKCEVSTTGNVVDWTNLKYTMQGYVIVEPNQIPVCP